MTIVLWIFAGLAATAFAYTMKFTQATLSYGRILGEVEAGTGVQDAITPPWQTNLAMISYIGVAATVGALWWHAGWGSGLGAIALILFGGGVVGAFLPDKEALHFRNLIHLSMISRHAEFVRHGDLMRAEAMKGLLIKAGLNLEGELKICDRRVTEYGHETKPTSLADEARKRAVELKAKGQCAEPGAEQASLQAIFAYEEVLSKKNGRRTRASRIWQLVERHGILEAVERTVNRDKGISDYTALVNMDLQEWAFEAVVLKYSEQFSKEAVERSRQRTQVWTDN